jgi:hypothetical protein
VSAEAFNGSAFVPYSSLPALQDNVHAVTFRNDSVCLVSRRGGYAVVPPSLGMCFYVCARMGLRMRRVCELLTLFFLCLCLRIGSGMEYTLDVRCMKGLNSTWDYKTNVPSDRQNFAVATFSGRLLVIGGWLHGPSAVVEAYDGSTWERMPDLLTPRSAAAAGCLLRFCPVLLLVLIPVCPILPACVL